MLLIVEPTYALSLGSYKKIQLKGPDADGFYCLHLERHHDDSESLPIARNHAVAAQVVEDVITEASRASRAFDWQQRLRKLYVPVVYEGRQTYAPGYAPLISHRDLEPGIRLGDEHIGVYLTTKRARELLAAMQAKTPIAGLWMPTRAERGHTGAATVTLKNGEHSLYTDKEVDAFARVLQSTLARGEKRAKNGTNLSNPVPS